MATTRTNLSEPILYLEKKRLDTVDHRGVRYFIQIMQKNGVLNRTVGTKLKELNQLIEKLTGFHKTTDSRAILKEILNKVKEVRLEVNNSKKIMEDLTKSIYVFLDDLSKLKIALGKITGEDPRANQRLEKLAKEANSHLRAVYRLFYKIERRYTDFQGDLNKLLLQLEDSLSRSKPVNVNRITYMEYELRHDVNEILSGTELAWKKIQKNEKAVAIYDQLLLKILQDRKKGRLEFPAKSKPVDPVGRVVKPGIKQEPYAGERLTIAKSLPEKKWYKPWTWFD